MNYNLVNPHNLCASDNSSPPRHTYASATVGRKVQMSRNPQAGLKYLKLHRHRKNHLHSAREKEEKTHALNLILIQSGSGAVNMR